jgi:phosphate starvation-inducible PhoH-like protein
MTQQTIQLGDNAEALALAGEHDANLKVLERALRCQVTLRGDQLRLAGDDGAVAQAADAIGELLLVIRSGRPVDAAEVESLVDIAVSENGRPSEVYGDVVWSHRGRQIGPRTVHQKQYVDAIRGNTITFGIGPAGTGKTYLAVAAAVEAFSNKRVGRIILTRPAVEAGESLGFLPGTISEKVDPYFRPLFDALYDMMSGDKLAALIEKGEIEIAPLAYMRGRTLNDSFVILDEAQNTTPEQIKMFLTRLGFGSLMVVTGDITQIDLPRGRQSGLALVPQVLGDIPDISFVTFDQRDVVRHKLVQRIVAAYKEYGERTEGGRDTGGRDASVRGGGGRDASGHDAGGS